MFVIQLVMCFLVFQQPAYLDTPSESSAAVSWSLIVSICIRFCLAQSPLRSGTAASGSIAPALVKVRCLCLAWALLFLGAWAVWRSERSEAS